MSKLKKSEANLIGKWIAQQITLSLSDPSYKLPFSFSNINSIIKAYHKANPK